MIRIYETHLASICSEIDPPHLSLLVFFFINSFQLGNAPSRILLTPLLYLPSNLIHYFLLLLESLILDHFDQLCLGCLAQLEQDTAVKVKELLLGSLVVRDFFSIAQMGVHSSLIAYFLSLGQCHIRIVFFLIHSDSPFLSDLLGQNFNIIIFLLIR